MLPAVPSTTVPPGCRRPSRSAIPTRYNAARSFTEPPGFMNSALPSTCKNITCVNQPVRTVQMSEQPAFRKVTEQASGAGDVCSRTADVSKSAQSGRSRHHAIVKNRTSQPVSCDSFRSRINGVLPTIDRKSGRMSFSKTFTRGVVEEPALAVASRRRICPARRLLASIGTTRDVEDVHAILFDDERKYNLTLFR